MKYALILFFSIQSSFVFSESYSEVSTVKGLTVGNSYARVQLSTMKETESCTNSKFYYLDNSESKDMFSTLLAAKASGQLVSLQLVGCANNMAQISHVYACDTSFCG